MNARLALELLVVGGLAPLALLWLLGGLPWFAALAQPLMVVWGVVIAAFVAAFACAGGGDD